MSLKDKLKKGQAFLGVDDNKYYFLGFDYDDQIFFTTLDLWSDKEQGYMTKNNIFIKEVLEEKSDIIENCTWYYQSMRELDNASMEDKIKRCLDIIDNSNTRELKIKPTEIGPLVRGQAYSKEFNQYYEVIGFLVDNNIYVDNELKTKQKGFFAIYHSNCESTVPLIFERNFSDKDNSFDGKHFVAGNEAKELTLKFEELTPKNEGAIFDPSSIERFAIYCNTVDNADVDSTIYFDNIRAVDSSKVPTPDEDENKPTEPVKPDNGGNNGNNANNGNGNSGNGNNKLPQTGGVNSAIAVVAALGALVGGIGLTKRKKND